MLRKGSNGSFELPATHDAGDEHALCIGDAKGRQLSDSERSEDDAIAAGAEPSPRRTASEIFHIGIGSIDVKKNVHDMTARRAINALNIPPCPAAQLYMHGPPSILPTSPSCDLPLELA